MNANEILLAAGFIAVLALWVFAELMWSRIPRILITLLLVAISCYSAHKVSMVLPRYESDLHAGCMDRLSDLLESGNTEGAREALTIYNETRKHANGYTAASEMWIHLNKTKK